MKVSVLFVCLGNICRSPTAHGVFQHLVERRGYTDAIHVDSCGTGDWHIGRPADQRSMAAALRRGYDLAALRARQVVAEDFRRFDYILAMDAENLHNLRQLCPADFRGELQLFLDYAEGVEAREVPDPYYGDADGFGHVLDLVENAAEGLLRHLMTAHRLHTAPTPGSDTPSPGGRGGA